MSRGLDTPTPVGDTQADPSPGLGRGAAIYIAGGALQFGGALLLFPVVTRVLDAEAFGAVVTLLLVTQLGVHLAGLGLPSAALREFFGDDAGPDRSGRVVVTSLPLAAGVVVALLATAPAWSAPLSGTGGALALSVALFSIAPRTATQVVLGRLRAQDRPFAFIVVVIINTVGAQLLAAAWCSVHRASILGFMLVYLVISLLTAGGALKLCHPGHRPLGRVELGTVLRYTVPIAGHSASALVLQVSDRFLIGALVGVDEVGQYQVAYMAATLTVPLVLAFNNSWAPRLAVLAGEAGFVPHFREVSRLLVLSAGLLGGALALGYPLAARLLLPTEFTSSEIVVVAAVVSVVAVPFVAYATSVHILVLHRHTRALWLINPSVAGFSIVANLVVLPRFGLVGAAGVTVVATAINAVLVGAAARPIVARSLPVTELAVAFLVGIGAAGLSVATAPGASLVRGVASTVLLAVFLLLVASRADQLR